jgi:hypothetical protein
VGRRQGLSKIKKSRGEKGSKGLRRRGPGGAAGTEEYERSLPPDKRSKNMEPHVSEDRIVMARQRISEGFYDRDEVRRAIAEALVFVLGARRD